MKKILAVILYFLFTLCSPAQQTETTNLPKITSKKGVFYYTKKGEVENIAGFSFEKLIKEKYKGKVVYIDVWFWGCGLCRAEMPHARELHKLFHDKDVVFLNICLASKQADWVKMMKSGDVVGENYYFEEDLTDEAVAKIVSGGFPTYILIDKTGSIRTKKAPRPSALAKISGEIEKLLAEK